eukprot:Gb_15819 [translate_table: standard]
MYSMSPASRKKVGQQVDVIVELPPLNEEGNLNVEFEYILGTRERQLRSKTMQEYSINWKHLPMEDGSWEPKSIFQRHPSLSSFEIKAFQGEGNCNDLPYE